MKIFKNYKVTKEKYEEFPIVKIFDHEEIFAELPFAVVEYGEEFAKPVLYGSWNGLPTIMELEDVKQALAHLKKFYLKEIEKGRVKETTPEEATIVIRLPKDTNLDELIFENGQIFWAKPQSEGVDE